MKTTLCFLFLQLISSLCSGELLPELHVDISPLGKELTEHTRELQQTPNQQQTREEDVNTVLREVSAILAEQRVEIRQLQKENQGQTAKLESQKTEVDKLKQQLQAQTAELSSLKARTNVTEIHVEELKTDKELKQVAFSASLLASGEGYLGPFNTEIPMVFRHVFTNIGNAYNPNTGFFTAPVRGVYQFDFYVHGHGNPSHPTTAALVKNGNRICISYARQPSHNVNSSNGVRLLLEVGDVVYLKLRQNSRVFDNENHPTTFSGHLLFTM
ncbi:caprin-2-like [Nelusetta ayraudi]|uniref:caprin-2-like n=1 Tax=Nelusetta ayraudi TaxID=303726 RepID=UPI003F6F2D34